MNRNPADKKMRYFSLYRFPLVTIAAACSFLLFTYGATVARRHWRLHTHTYSYMHIQTHTRARAHTHAHIYLLYAYDDGGLRARATALIRLGLIDTFAWHMRSHVYRFDDSQPFYKEKSHRQTTVNMSRIYFAIGLNECRLPPRLKTVQTKK